MEPRGSINSLRMQLFLGFYCASIYLISWMKQMNCAEARGFQSISSDSNCSHYMAQESKKKKENKKKDKSQSALSEN